MENKIYEKELFGMIQQMMNRFPGTWLRVGILVANDTEEDKTVYIEITGVEVRIE